MSLLKLFGLAYGTVLALSAVAMIGCVAMVISRLNERCPRLSMKLGAALLVSVLFAVMVGLQFSKAFIPILFGVWFFVGVVFCVIFLNRLITQESHAEIEGPITIFILVFSSSAVPVIMFGAVYHVFF